MIIKLHRNSTSEKIDIYKFIMDIFDNGKSEEFLFNIPNLNMMLEAPIILAVNVEIQYLRTLLRDKELHNFEDLRLQIWKYDCHIFKQGRIVFRCVMFPVNTLSNKKHLVRRGMRNLEKLKEKCFVARMVQLNEYFTVFTGG